VPKAKQPAPPAVPSTRARGKTEKLRRVAPLEADVRESRIACVEGEATNAAGRAGYARREYLKIV
jgi:hypothetical protein